MKLLVVYITNITEMVEIHTEIKIRHSYIHSVVIILKILHMCTFMHAHTDKTWEENEKMIY